jgi:hypothetical protein
MRTRLEEDVDPLRIIIKDTSSKHIFNDLIHSLDLTISLRMVGCASDKMGAKAFMKLFPETCHKMDLLS